MSDIKCDIKGNLSVISPRGTYYTREELEQLIGGKCLFVHLVKTDSCVVVSEEIRNLVGAAHATQYNALATKWVYDGVDYPIDSPDYIAGPALLISEKRLKFPIY